MSITLNGTTGITTPADSFQGSVSGVVKVQPASAAGTWTMTLPTTAGTSGYVLSTDGTGITSWVAQSGGGGSPGGSNTQVQYNSSGTFAGSSNLTFDGTNLNIAGTAVMGSSFLRNRIINGNMYIAQRATSATVTAGTAVPTASTGYPCVDRFFVYSTGANVTAAQVAGSGANKNLLQITGAASVTAIGIGQRIEQLNSYDLAGQTCTLSVSIANSLLTTVTWTASYATTADTFGTIGTPTKTQIATGTFTVSSTLTRYTANISVPSAATTGIEILFTVGAQTSGTWQIGNVQFEAGSIATPFERPIYPTQLSQCYRYYRRYANTTVTYIALGVGMNNSTTSIIRWGFSLDIAMRVVPSVSFTNCVGWDFNVGGSATPSASYCSTNVIDIDITTSGLTSGVQGRLAKVLIGFNGYAELFAEM
jgi:hypothetical protein